MRAGLWLLLASGCSAVASGPSGVDAGDSFFLAPSGDGGDVSELAAISGQVTLFGTLSSQGATATLAPGGLSAAADSSGSYLLAGVLPGSYVLTFAAPGFQSQNVAVTIAGSDSLVESAVLERSLQLVPAGSLHADGGWWLQGVPETAVDAGALPVLFAGDGTSVWAIDPAAEAVPLWTSDGGYQFLGLDSRGSAVVATLGAEATANFVGPLELATVALGPASSAALAGDEVFFATPEPGDAGAAAWSAIGRDDLDATPLALDIDSSSAPVFGAGRAVGWQEVLIDGAQCHATTLFGVGVQEQLARDCGSNPSPVQVSVDGDRFGFATDRGGACVIAETAEFFPVPVAAKVPVYPLASAALLLSTSEASGDTLLTFQTLDGGVSTQDVLGFAPLHGEALLYAAAGDAGTVLTVAGSAQAIPFDHPWGTPWFSTDNRYVVLQGVPSVFDLQQSLEVPLVLTPSVASFDRALQQLLIVDASGAMAVVQLARLGTAHGQPAGTVLEGKATAASFGADQASIAYFGTDALENPGLFVEPIPTDSP